MLEVGLVKVEYAFETARIRLHLPLKGETWFFLDQKVTLKDFKEQCQAEDSCVQDLKILDGNKREFRNEEALSLYTLLTTDKQQIYIKLNENLNLFPGV